MSDQIVKKFYPFDTVNADHDIIEKYGPQRTYTFKKYSDVLNKNKENAEKKRMQRIRDQNE